MADRAFLNRVCIHRTLLTALFVCAFTLALAGCGKSGGTTDKDNKSDATQKDETPKTQTVEINGHTFELELALDDAARELGLSDRKEIAEDGGMLFVLPTPRRASFVMRRCHVPIDLIYVDSQGYIDTLHRMKVIEPIGGTRWLNGGLGYPSAGAVQFVIELKGGTLDKLGLDRGDKIELPYDTLQSMAQ